jgi:hypothetical protein
MPNSTPEYLAAHIGERQASIPSSYANAILAQRRAERRAVLGRRLSTAVQMMKRTFRHTAAPRPVQRLSEGVPIIATPATEEVSR